MLRITSIEYASSPVRPTFKTGEHRHSKGYIRISSGPFRDKYLHTLIWQWTHPGEFYDPKLHDIHHRDGDPTNFHPDNLEKVAHRRHFAKTMEAKRLDRKPNGQFASGPEKRQNAELEPVPF